MARSAKYTFEDLRLLQAQPFERKVRIAQTRIIEWYERFEGYVYVAFSGGKDSSILLDLVRRIYPDVEAVFNDTGMEYPEIKDFVKSFDNVTVLHPIKWDKHKKEWKKTNFREVIERHGYPIISKEVADTIEGARNSIAAGKDSYRLRKLNGLHFQKNGKPSAYNLTCWKWLLDAPFKISDKCCQSMKKNPAKQYQKKVGKRPMTGQIAYENRIRRMQWLMNGCNGFHMSEPVSNPISFWTEQDVLKYIQRFNLPIAGIYGEVREEKNGKLRLTGLDRSGCVFCMFGIHREPDPNRFQRMRVTHPKLYEYCMRPAEDGGLGIKKCLDYIGVRY